MKAAPLPRFFKKRKLPTANIVAVNEKKSKTPAYRTDPILQHLRQHRLPIVWVMGLPTNKIDTIRHIFCSTFAKKHNFAYINLDEFIDIWKKRQNSNNLYNNLIDVPVHLKVKIFDESIPTVSPIISEIIESDHIKHEITEIDHSIEECIVKSKNLSETIKNLDTVDEVGGVTVDEKDQVESESVENNDIERIKFDPNEKLTMTNVIELLKFAMIESLPTNGFLIEDFPLDLGDVTDFERIFYPGLMGIYFSESYFRNEVSGRAMGPLKRKLILPQNYKRKKHFTYAKAERLCESHGHKIIRITNAESVSDKTLNLLETLLDSNLTTRKVSTAAESPLLQLGRIDDFLCIDKNYDLRPIRKSENLYTLINGSTAGTHNNNMSYSAFDDYVSKTENFSKKPTPTTVQSTVSSLNFHQLESVQDIKSGIIVMDIKHLSGIPEEDETEAETYTGDDLGNVSEFSSSTGRIKKRRTRFTKFHEDGKELGVSDEIPTQMTPTTSDQPVWMKEDESTSGKNLDSDEDDERENKMDDSDWSSTSNTQYHYTTEWELESEDDKAITSKELPETNKPQSSKPIQENNRIQIDEEEICKNENRTESEGSKTMRSRKQYFSPDAHVDYLMTVARISMESSSNESIEKTLRKSRGRSRVRRTRKLEIYSKGEKPKTVYEYSSVPKSISRDEKPKATTMNSLLGKLESGDMGKTSRSNSMFKNNSKVHHFREQL